VAGWWQDLRPAQKAQFIGAVTAAVIVASGAVIAALLQPGGRSDDGPVTTTSSATSTLPTTTTRETTTTTTPPTTPPPFPKTAEEAARLFKVNNAEAQLQKTPAPTQGWHTDSSVSLSVFATACVDVEHGPKSASHVVQGQARFVGTSSNNDFDRYSMETEGVVTGAATIYWGGCPTPP
jgi:hypothetical protein